MLCFLFILTKMSILYSNLLRILEVVTFTALSHKYIPLYMYYNINKVK